jgi:hypothetical protein
MWVQFLAGLDLNPHPLKAKGAALGISWTDGKAQDKTSADGATPSLPPNRGWGTNRNAFGDGFYASVTFSIKVVTYYSQLIPSLLFSMDEP